MSMSLPPHMTKVTVTFPQTDSMPENITKHYEGGGGIALPFISTFYFITLILKLSLSRQRGLGVHPRQAHYLFFDSG